MGQVMKKGNIARNRCRILESKIIVNEATIVSIGKTSNNINNCAMVYGIIHTV